jgi:hypothetical protein
MPSSSSGAPQSAGQAMSIGQEQHGVVVQTDQVPSEFPRKPAANYSSVAARRSKSDSAARVWSTSVARVTPTTVHDKHSPRSSRTQPSGRIVAHAAVVAREQSMGASSVHRHAQSAERLAARSAAAKQPAGRALSPRDGSCAGLHPRQSVKSPTIGATQRAADRQSTVTVKKSLVGLSTLADVEEARSGRSPPRRL